MQGYLIVFTVTLLAAALLVITQRWHGHLSMDGTSGVQKFHIHPTPRIGGLAIACGLLAAYTQTSALVREILAPMLIAGIPAFGAGLLEDITKRVGVKPRLLATMFSGVVAWYLTGVVMNKTGIAPIDWMLSFTPIAVLFTAFAVGGVANAINIIDGFNGLATGAVAIMLFGMGLIAVQVGDGTLASVCFLLAAVILGFWAINWPMGNIFLGDGGAYLVGFMLAWIAVLLPMRNPSVTAWATLLVCAYPVLEVFFSFIRKSKRAGHHPGHPDKVHLHMLMYRRISRKLFPNANRALQNGLTSPFAWIYTLIPVGWAVVSYDQELVLAIGLLVAMLTYWALYMRLTQFRWCFTSLTVSKKHLSAA